jgi:hypothetical protein
MTWTEVPDTTASSSGFAEAQLAYSLQVGLQNDRAALVVAGRALDALDCAEMLAMLGLDVPVQREPKY